MNIKIFSVVILMALAFNADAGSIWAKRDKNMRQLYSDDVARQIGDVITIRITEQSKVDNKAKRDLKKDASKAMTFNGELGNFVDLGEFGTDIEASNEMKGKADFKDERSFADRVTVVVVDVMPNGNLVVMGSRTRDIAGDKQLLEISGIVRPSDIAYDNTVKSEQVADFRIVTKNSGISEPYNRPGWLGGLLDIIWPF